MSQQGFVVEIAQEARAEASCGAIYNRAMAREFGVLHQELTPTAWIDTFEGSTWSRCVMALGADGATIGFCLVCGYDGGPSVIQMLAVAPERQGQGVGRELLSRALDECDRSRPGLAVAFVRTCATRAQAFYARSGGLIGYGIEDQDYYGAPVHPVIFGVGPGGRESEACALLAMSALTGQSVSTV